MEVSRKWALVAVLWLATFGLSLLLVSFVNDHFDRISRARQIFVYGEHPFADFRDPGYFLTLYVSAAAQAATGGSLLGEALLASAAIATAAALTFWLAASASGSLAIGVIAACLTWVVAPRYYDYDKVLFYMAGLTAAWRYIERPTRSRLAAAGIVTALAALFRYDNGLYVSVACLTAIAARQWGNRSGFLSDLATYLAAAAVALAPALTFVQLTAGLPEAVRQIVEYAAREGQRSGLFSLPRLTWDRTSALYVLIVATGPAALLYVGLRLRSKQASLQGSEGKILAAALLCTCVSIFVLRDPVSARLGAAAPPALVLAAWIAGQWRWRSHRYGPAALVLLGVCATMLAVLFPEQGRRLLRAPFAVASRLATVVTELGAAPQQSVYFPEEGALAGLASYLRECTPPDARVLMTWFAPELFFFSERGFAGGMAVFLGTHWSSERDQRRTIEQADAQPVPAAIVQVSSEREFRSNFPHVAAHLDTNYRGVEATSFANPRVGAGAYRVLIRRDLGGVPTEATWGLPCPAQTAEVAGF